MAQDWAVAFYHSPAWLKNRATYMELYVDTSGHRLYTHYRDGITEYYWVDEFGHEVKVASRFVVPPKLCERCFSRGEYIPAKVVHHKIWLTPENIDDPHVTLSYDNFQRLCQDCHAAVHHPESESRVTFDEQGRIVWKDDDGYMP